MNRGYVKLWRKVFDTGLIQNPEAFTFFGWCLLKATHKPITQLVGSQAVDLFPGQFIFGRKAAASELKTTERKIRTCFDLLSKLEIMTSKPTNKFTVITLVNWSVYQNSDSTNDQQDDQPATSKRPASDQETTTNKKLRSKEAKKEPKTFVRPTIEQVETYCQERGKGVDPHAWMDHYTSNGFKIGGRGAMKDWKAAVRTWERNGFSAAPTPPQPRQAPMAHSTAIGAKRLEEALREEAKLEKIGRD